jgi:hypothetical protein
MPHRRLPELHFFFHFVRLQNFRIYCLYRSLPIFLITTYIAASKIFIYIALPQTLILMSVYTLLKLHFVQIYTQIPLLPFCFLGIRLPNFTLYCFHNHLQNSPYTLCVDASQISLNTTFIPFLRTSPLYRLYSLLRNFPLYCLYRRLRTFPLYRLNSLLGTFPLYCLYRRA